MHVLLTEWQTIWEYVGLIGHVQVKLIRAGGPKRPRTAPQADDQFLVAKPLHLPQSASGRADSDRDLRGNLWGARRQLHISLGLRIPSPAFVHNYKDITLFRRPEHTSVHTRWTRKSLGKFTWRTINSGPGSASQRLKTEGYNVRELRLRDGLLATR